MPPRGVSGMRESEAAAMSWYAQTRMTVNAKVRGISDMARRRESLATVNALEEHSIATLRNQASGLVCY